MIVGHWMFLAFIALQAIQAWAKFDYIPRSAKSSDPFRFLSDGDDNTCMAIPNATPTRLQMSVPDPWIEDVAWFSIRGRHLGCHGCTSTAEKLYLMPLVSPLSLTESPVGIKKTCKLEESNLEGTLENCTFSCRCETSCSHVYLAHFGLKSPQWELCAWEFKGTGACGFVECLNGGSCVNLGDNYTCSCPEGYTGRHCEKDTRPPTCTEMGSAAAVAVYDSTTAGMTLNSLFGISISNITGSVALPDFSGSKVHVMDADLNAGNVIDQYRPHDTTYDDKGFLYVTDHNDNRVHVYNSTGYETSSFGSGGSGPGQFSYPHGITHKSGVLPKLYVCDQGNYRVQVFHTNSTFIAAFGASHFDSNPRHIAVDTNIYVSDTSGRLYIFTSTYTLINKFIADRSPLYSYVRGIALYNGCLIVADDTSDSIKVFDGSYSLVATIGSPGASVGQLLNPQGIAVTPLGAIYVAENGNKRVQLFKVP